MTREQLRLVHVAPHAHGYGGIETLLARHAAADASFGIESVQVGLFEKNTAPAPRYLPQRFGWRSTPHSMRRAMARTCEAHPGSITVWHNAWALPWFADVDQSTRRVMVMHANPEYYAAWLPTLEPLLDGVLAVSPAGVAAAREWLPRLNAERTGLLPLPIAPPADLPPGRPSRTDWVIGCAGRLMRPQKRWDRLVPFVRELRGRGARFTLEIIGAGPLRPWLERELRGEPAVQFLGFVETRDYWRRLQTWDAALFFSDVEGGPIVMLEAMAAGAVPFYPRIGGSLGDDYAPRIDPRCHYPAGDVAAAARAVQEVLSSPTTEVLAMRQRAQALAAAHRGNNYETSFADFIRRIEALPRISQPPNATRPSRWTDRVPLGLITRLLPQALWR